MTELREPPVKAGSVLDRAVRVQGDPGGYPRPVAWARPVDVLAAMDSDQRAALASVVAVVIDMPEHVGPIAAARAAVDAICSLPLDPRPGPIRPSPVLPAKSKEME